MTGAGLPPASRIRGAEAGTGVRLDGSGDRGQDVPARDLWEPRAYESFAEARMRPALDLVARIPRKAHARLVVDAGCGTGRTTKWLATQFRQADVIGIDASERMVGLAQGTPRVRFEQADLTSWRPPRPVDVVVCNAVLHWVPEPRAALEHMMAWLAPAGILALQVPANFDRPSHMLVHEAAARLGLEVAPVPDLGLASVAGWLGPGTDAWETTYLHMLTGPDAVLRWLSGTTLRPYLMQDKTKVHLFLEDLRTKLAAAYPPTPHGTPFAFTRRFWVASREP